MFLPGQSESERMWTFKVRWRAILTPVCLVAGHTPQFVQSMWLASPSHERCRRCYKVLWEEDFSTYAMPDSEGEALPAATEKR